MASMRVALTVGDCGERMLVAGLYWDLGEAQARALAANPVPIDTR